MYIGIDFSNVQTLSDNTLLPEGDYTFQIIGTDIRESQSGNRYMSLSYKVMDKSQFYGVVVYDNFNLWNPNPQAVEIAQRKLKTLASVAGHPSPNAIHDTEEFYGLFFVGHVTIREFNGNKSNNVKSYRPALKQTQEPAPSEGYASSMDDVPF